MNGMLWKSKYNRNVRNCGESREILVKKCNSEKTAHVSKLWEDHYSEQDHL